MNLRTSSRRNLTDLPNLTLTPETHAFGRFLKLADASPERIRAFAERNGVLGLCQHGLPIGHGNIDPTLHHSPYCSFGFNRDSVLEPLESWVALSREAAALLMLNVERGGPVSPREDREKVWQDALWLHRHQYQLTGHGGPPLKIRVPNSRLPRTIARIVQEWLRCGGVLPRFYWDTRVYRFALELDAEFGPNLFGFLAVQLAMELAAIERWAVCAECKNPFKPTVNTISPRRRSFCDECGRAHKPQLYATRAYRARIRDACQMKAQGATVEQIAQKLRALPERVRKWTGANP